MKILLKILIILTLLIPTPAHADWRDPLPDNLRINGRYFLAGGYTFDRFILKEDTFAEINLRLNGRYTLNPNWKLEFAYQVDGTYYPHIAALSGPSSDGLLDLSWPIDSKTNWTASHGLDRLNFNYRDSDFTLDFGRQRIAWGTTMILSFMDMFHPIRPGDPFVPEQQGTDAIRLQIADGLVSGYDLLYSWLDNDGTEAFAARYHFVKGDFETGISVGQIDGDNFAAFETSGDIDDIGIRIEAQWIDVDENKPFRIILESDFAPNERTYLSGDIFYNGPGGTEPKTYLLNMLTRGESFGVGYPARWYAGTYCTYNSGGLTTFGVLGVFNLTDDSWLADISINHSISNSSDLRIGYQHYEGGLVSEYGNYPDMIYVISTSYF